MIKLIPDFQHFTTTKPLLRQFDESGQPVLNDGSRYIVKTNDEGHWDFVEPHDEVVGTEDLAANYGFWRDRQIKKEGFFRDTVVRPFNKTIEADEVVPFAQAFDKAHDFATSNYETLANSYNRAMPLHSRLSMTRNGATLDTQWKTVSSFRAHQGRNKNVLAGDFNFDQSLRDIKSGNY